MQLARGLAQLGYEVSYVDYVDGQAAKELPKYSGVNLLTVQAFADEIRLGSSPLILISPIYIASQLPSLPKGSRILFVNWHKLSLKVLTEVTGEPLSSISNFSQVVLQKRAVFFADESHALGQYPGLDLLDRIVPIPIEPKKNDVHLEICDAERVNFALVGRLSIDKIHSVRNFLENFHNLKTGKGKRLYLIGEGEMRNAINSESYPSVEVVFIKTLRGAELENFLITEVDALFAMGSSALVGSSLGVPTVLLPSDSEAITGNLFLFIQDSRNGCLGWESRELESLGLSATSLDEIYQQIYVAARKGQLGQAARDYTLASHDLSSSLARLAQLVAGTALTPDDVISTLNLDQEEMKMRQVGGKPWNLFLTYRQSVPNHLSLHLFGKPYLKLPVVIVGEPDQVWRSLEIFGIPMLDINVQSKAARLQRPKQQRIWEQLQEQLKLNLSREINERSDNIANRLGELEEQLKLNLSREINERSDNIENRLGELQEQLGQEVARGTSEVRTVVSATSPLAKNYVPMRIPKEILSEECLTKFRGDISSEYTKLVSGLDKESVGQIVRVLNRLRAQLPEGDKYWFTQIELRELEAIYDSHASNLIKLKDNLWAYGKYLLPEGVISTTTFYSRYFLNELRDLNKIRTRAVIDVGGFMGDTALILDEFTDLGVHVFEPSAESVRLCKQTAQLNSLSKLVINPFALGDEDTTSHLLRDSDGSRILQPHEVAQYGKTDVEEIKVIRLDDYVRAKNLKVGLIKVDVEGFEEKVLRGSLETIQKQRPTLIVSMYHSFDQFFGLKGLIESLDLGYSFRVKKPHDLDVIVDTVLIAEVKE